MALRDPRDVERAVDDLRAQMSTIMNDEARPEQDRRDAVMRMTGEMAALEVQARELREFELEQARAAVESAKSVSNPSAEAEHVKAFNAFVKSGDINNAALLTTPDANGGYIMPNPMREQVLDIVRKGNPIMADATVFNMTKPGTFQIELPYKATASTGGWVAETDARPATDAPTLGSNTLTAYEWYANPEATQAFLDAVAGAEQFLLNDIAGTFAEKFASALASGDGNGKPSGLFAATTTYTTKLSSTADSLDAAQILGAYFALPSKFLPNAKFYANGATFAALSALAWPNMNNTPLVRWETGAPTIMGKPVIICDDAPAIGNGAFPLAFGDLSAGYAVGMHSQIVTLRDPYTNKPKVGFYTTGRAGGRPWDKNAVLLLKSDNA